MDCGWARDSTESGHAPSQGFLRIFGLDSWKHHEVIRRDSATSLVITDKLVWHSGRSTAQRKWGVRSCESGGLVRTEGKWHIAMNGVRWPVRGRVEAAMRGALPAAAEGNMAAFFRSRASAVPSGGQHRLNFQKETSGICNSTLPWSCAQPRAVTSVPTSNVEHKKPLR